MTEHLTRRDLLRLTAGVAGAAALPPALSAAPASAAQVGAILPQAAVPDLLADDVFPIGFYWPPPRRQINDERYDEIASAGFNLVLGGNDVYNKNANVRLLEVADRHGLRVLAVDQRISSAVPTPGYADRIRAVLEEYQQYNAFAGFRIVDEPNPVTYPRYRMITDVLAEAAPSKLSHLNLVPVYNPAWDRAYETYLERYVEQIAPSFVSFDHYPLLKDGTFRQTFFLNHKLIREAGNRAGLPTWVYVCSVDHGVMKRPTPAELAWQINMGLAYGCKGVKYFTYWTPTARPDFEFGTALIDKAGCQTPLYDAASTFNRTFLQPVGRQLKHLQSKQVFHTGPSQPLGAEPFSAARSRVLSAVSSSPMVLGEYERPTDDGQSWIFAVNRSYTTTTDVSFTLKPEVSSAEVFSPSSIPHVREYVPVPLRDGGRTFSVSLAPGQAELYRTRRTT
ncbi:hypothetical protein ABGB14_11595 [Nonomuraea sp. B10E15]|uniref:hypothetical protein n=1 Tax=Nonomuraea sp. B10E15 TaxID=3153560 RepID=UPI00325EACEF